MPGLLGILNDKNLELRNNFINAFKSLKNYENAKFKDDLLFEDENIIACRTHLEIIGENNSPYVLDDLHCWIEGEIYNLDEIRNIFNINCNSFSDLLLQAYKNNIFENVLQKIDGYYTSVIYDKYRQIIKIISDRHALKPLYVYSDNNSFAWTSELKAFLYFKEYNLKIEEKSIETFMGLGHMMGNYTWFKNVELLSSSTILTFDIKNKSCGRKKYWNWSNISYNSIPYNDARIILGDLLKKAIQKRYSSDRKMSVSLSGGLDSRAMLAEIAEESNVTAFTFAKERSTDLEIAKIVSNIKNVNHKLFLLDKENWFNSRIEGIWRTDGLINCLHLHVSMYIPELADFSEINLNGFAGDLIFGGGWIQKINSRITEESAKNKFKKYIEFSPISDEFYNINHEDPYYLENRVRRFTNLGIIESEKYIEQRRPFYDNNLMEFIYSLDDHYRVKSKIYKDVLLNIFPEYYNTIPWQKTGITINKKMNKFHKIKRKISRIPIKLGIVEDYDNYADYKNWIKEEKFVKLFSNILNSKNAIYIDYTKENYYNKFLIPHIEGKADYTEEIGRAITMELWFQNSFNKNNFEYS